MAGRRGKKEHSSDSSPSQHMSHEDLGEKLLPPPIKLCPSPEFLHKKVPHPPPPRALLLGPQFRWATSDWDLKLPFFVLFCLPFLLYSWMRMSQMLRARALIRKVETFTFVPLLFPSSCWPGGCGDQGAGLSCRWSSCHASPLFADNH